MWTSLPHYRREFYERLRAALAADGITLRVAYGTPHEALRARDDLVELPWGTRVRNRIVTVAGRPLYWQPVLRLAVRADLVVVEQASKLLTNYALMALQRLGLVRLAFWGHGTNLQAHTASRLGEAVKHRYSTRCVRWFAYTEGSAARVRALGYPADRITVVQNAFDTAALAAAVAAVTPEQRRALRDELGVAGDARVVAYVGGLYPDKRPEFLMAAADALAARDPAVVVVAAGAGVSRATVAAWAAGRPHARYLGPLFGEQRARLLAVAELLLMPGLVGLGVLDAFAAEVPLVTTDVPYHSPEIEYLVDGGNGMCLPRDTTPEQYAEAVAALLHDPARLARLRAGCRAAAAVYTVDEMVRRYADGVRRALPVGRVPAATAVEPAAG